MQVKFFRKSANCLNCGHPLLENHNFCPRCGQKNTHNIVALDEFVKDLFATVFNFDSRWARTFKPFFIKPGELTKTFIEGQRMHFTDPLKLYFFASLLFFLSLSNFIVNPLGSYLNEKRNKFEKTKDMMDFSLDLDSMNVLADSLKAVNDTILKTIEAKEEKTSGKKSKKILLKKEVLADNEKDTTQNNDSEGFWRFLHYIENRNLTPAQLLDSLSLREKPQTDGAENDLMTGAFGLYVASKLQKIGRNDFVNYIAKYVDWISFFIISLLPLFAAILSVLNLRMRRFYIEHLIFTIHIQAFAYVFLALCLLFFALTDFWAIFLLGFVVSYIYAVMAFRNVYGQDWFKSAFKTFTLGFFYFTALCIGLPLHGIFVFLIY